MDSEHDEEHDEDLDVSPRDQFEELGLTEKTYRCLLEASVEIVERLFSDVLLMHDWFGLEPDEKLPYGEMLAETQVISALPKQYRAWYTPTFAEAFLLCTARIGRTIASDDDAIHCICTAEELALTLTTWLALTLNPELPEEAYSDFIEYNFDDTDFMMLFWDESTLRGFEPDDEKRAYLFQRTRDFTDMAMAVEGWFKPFRDEAVPHPYAQMVMAEDATVALDLVTGEIITSFEEPT